MGHVLVHHCIPGMRVYDSSVLRFEILSHVAHAIRVAAYAYILGFVPVFSMTII